MDARKIVRTGLRVIGYLAAAILVLVGLALVYHTLTSRSSWEELEYERKIPDLERGLEFPVPAPLKEGLTT